MNKIAAIFETEPHYGGGHQYAVLVAECLLKNGNFVAICGTRFWVNWCRKHKISYIKKQWLDFSEKDMKRWMRFPMISRFFYWWFSEIGTFLRKEEVDTLVIAQHGTVIPPCFCKIICPAHDLMHRYCRTFPEVAKEEYTFREIFFRNMARSADIVLTDSNLGKRQFIDAYGDYMHKGIKVCALPYVAPPHVWEPKEEYIETPERFIFYPAQFWMHKNHINLVKAVELLKEKLPDIKLLLIGSEKNSQGMVKRYIYEHGLDRQVFIYGFINNEKLVYLYRHAVAMFMPSYYGPTNIPPLEAMALGCPVAVSNNFAMGEQVGKAGLLFSPDSPEEIADCIYQVWTDEEKRQEMIREGYQQIKRWNKEKFEKKFLNIVNGNLKDMKRKIR